MTTRGVELAVETWTFIRGGSSPVVESLVDFSTRSHISAQVPRHCWRLEIGVGEALTVVSETATVGERACTRM